MDCDPKVSDDPSINSRVTFHDFNDVITDTLTFPRCEYKTRFKGTTTFHMKDKEYWATYFREIAAWGDNFDRIARLNDVTTYENLNINQPPNGETLDSASAGTKLSPWRHAQYTTIFYPKMCAQCVENEDTFLYDQLLEYKLHVCKKVVEVFNDQAKLERQDWKIDVYVNNDYPCVMVQIKQFNELLDDQKGVCSLYKIVVAYFIAITNNVACAKNVPVEIVSRMSFGFNIPTAAEIGASFRISIGLVPKVYAKVLATSLVLLNNKFLVPLLNKKDDFLFIQNGRVRMDCNNESKTCQQKRSKKLSNLITVLTEPRDTAGTKLCSKITGQRYYIDMLADLVSSELEKAPSVQHFALPLTTMLEKLHQENGGDLARNHDNSCGRYEFSTKEHRDIAKDKRFWAVIESIASIFQKRGISNLSNFVKRKKLLGLYSALERANLEFIRRSGSQDAEDGYGSDSDCEVEFEDTTFYSKKITLSTGMRAINLAQFLAKSLTREAKHEDRYMYFESKMSLPLVKNSQRLNLQHGESEQSEVRYIDLNYCAFAGSSDHLPKLSAKPQEGVMVFDHTSATSRKVGEAVKLIRKVPILLLVGSGLKNEQIGADMNPYGTMRIVARSRKLLDKLHYILMMSLSAKEALPKESHSIRKAYRAAGAVITSERIYTAENGFKYHRTRGHNSNSCDLGISDTLVELKRYTAQNGFVFPIADVT